MDLQKSSRKNPLKNAEGFTLLEIIAVIVIMSILAVVAVPKYFSLQEQARQRAFGVGKAEAIGRVNGYFAEQVLAGARPSDIQYTTTNLDGPDMGDFQFSVDADGAGNTTTFTITISGTTGTEMEGLSETVTIDRPGL